MKKANQKNDLKKGVFALSVIFLWAFSTPIYSVELTKIEVNSLLNEPLDAKIELAKAEEIKIQGLVVDIAPRYLYEKEGLEPLDWIYTIDVKVDHNPKTGKIKILLTTPEPVKDPFADLIVTATWEGGSTVRQYVLLLDPPRIAVPDSLAPQRKKAKVASKEKEAGKVALLVKQRAGKRRFERAQARVVRPGGRYKPSSADDESVWNVANKLIKDTPYTVTQGLVALANRNPIAFKDGNINSYQSNATLELPTAHDLGSYSEEDAQYFVDAQNEAWEQEYIKASEASASQYVHPETMVDVPSDLKPLRLVAPGGENVSADTIDALKRTQEIILESNQILKDQNENLAELLVQKEKEIESLKVESAEPVTSIALSDLEEFIPHSRSSSVKNVILYLIIGTMLLFSLFVGLMFFRDQMEIFIKKWKAKIFKNLHSHRNSFTEMLASFTEVKRTVSFDIEKALAVLSQKEKQYINVDQEAVLHEIDGLIAYEKYNQAKKMLKNILKNNAENWGALLKLLNLYVTTENYREFETECLILPLDLNEKEPEVWEKIESLKSKVNSERC